MVNDLIPNAFQVQQRAYSYRASADSSLRRREALHPLFIRRRFQAEFVPVGPMPINIRRLTRRLSSPVTVGASGQLMHAY